MLGGTVNFIVAVFGSMYLAGIGVTNALVLSLPAMIGVAGAMTGSMVYVVVNRRLALIIRSRSHWPALLLAWGWRVPRERPVVSVGRDDRKLRNRLARDRH